MQRASALALTAVAGYVDTVAFICADGLFAAHVTGNLVVFGATLGRSVTIDDSLKLLAFPLFVLGVSVGATVFCTTARHRAGGLCPVVLLQATLLAAVGVAALTDPSLSLGVGALPLVAAMGMQNALHRYVPGPMTTVMTGAVMHWSAARAERLLRLSPPSVPPAGGGAPTAGMIACFAAGCAAAGVVTPAFGFGAVLLPALALPAVAWRERAPTRS